MTKSVFLKTKHVFMKKLLLLLTIATCAKSGWSQLVITPELNDTVFVYSLAGPGIVVSNIERNCSPDASSFFNATDANVGIENGILLSSGLYGNAQGPNNLGGASGYNYYPGDTDLDALTDWTTYDACIIEFDMAVMADTLKLNYVFASEEYLEYTFSGFNDVFAFWVSGPDIPTPTNIAVVPGTDLPVTINNINNIANADYYIDNGDGYAAPYSTDDYYIQYDGLTTVLLATIPVTAGETYHMKMAIADASDGILDSGVFLETGSLGSLRMHHETLADNGLSFAVEKCADGYFKIINEIPCAEPLVIDYHIAGSADNGIDYETITEQLTIPAWDSVGYIYINPIFDGVDEVTESVVLYLYNPQSGFVYDTLTMLINDEAASADFDATIAELTASFTETSGAAVSATWNFGDGQTSTELNPVHTYAADGYYLVCVTSTNAFGCESEYCREVAIGNVDINQFTLDLQVSPNPATDAIQVSGVEPGAIAIVRDLRGAVVMQSVCADQTATFDISALSSGMYTIEIRGQQSGGISLFEKQ